MAEGGGAAGKTRRGAASPPPQARLRAYRQKRDFKSSPEPSGSAPAAAVATTWSRLPRGHRFCVQLHRATRLHYDFRLEHGGTLLSWAVPKGPSMDPSARRLAVQVEDHPVDYGDFEDVIPSGYGRGTVLVWDTGSFAFEKGPKGDADEGLVKGHLDFRLEGQRLRGVFSLIRMDGRMQGDKPQWLLFKRRDQDAHQPWQAPPATSVKTGRSLDEVAAGDPAAPVPEAELGGEILAAPLGVPPSRLEPMLATPAPTPFSRPGWLFELKYDGVRALLRWRGGRVTVQGRSGRDETDRYPELGQAGEALQLDDCLLDGEIVALDERGAPSFSRLQPRMQLQPALARQAAQEAPVTYMAFDLLFAGGHDLRRLPLRQRKELLRQALRPSARLRYADHVEERGQEFFETVAHNHLEGLVAKRADSAYLAGRRSPDWLKLKVRPTQDCVICGYTRGQGSRHQLGALLLAVFDEGRLVDAGRVGTGFSQRQLQELRAELDRHRRPTPPLSPPPPAGEGAVWVEPELVCEVEHAGWTPGGKLRQPSFRSLRPDVAPADCRRAAATAAAPPRIRAGAGAVGTSRRVARSERPEPADSREAALEQLSELPARGGPLELDGRRLALTNLDKVLWPESGTTKRQLIAYHLRLAPFLLPHLRDRAVVTQVFPDGVAGKSFWRRAVPAGAPDWIPRWEAHPGTPTLCPLIQEPAALVWLANLAAIDIHPWHSRRDRPTLPDWAAFDLDPAPGADFAEVIEVARVIKAGLDHLGLRAWLKTTGQKGLHVYVPLRRGPEQEAVRDWVGRFAHQVAEALPKLVTENWSVRQRGGKIRIDFTQNVVGKTLAAVYSPRPTAAPTVSTPIAWEELAGLDPRSFSLQEVARRVGERGDLFQEVLGGSQRLPPIAADENKSADRPRRGRDAGRRK
ncbi:MAG: DNA ligase D [Candidatus Dormibacteria bacterium]